MSDPPKVKPDSSKLSPLESGASPEASDSSLTEGLDYTIDPDSGFLIMTRDYLLRRGHCCENGCRNCPYGFTA